MNPQVGLADLGQIGLDGSPMDSKKYRAAIDRLKLSQVKAGKFLGVGQRSSRRWALDEAAIPESVAMVLGLMIALKLTPEKVDKLLGREPQDYSDERR